MKKIVIVATGGTIAGSGKAGKTANYHAGTIAIENIVESIPLINDVADLEAIQLFNFDSNEMNEERRCAGARGFKSPGHSAYRRLCFSCATFSDTGCCTAAWKADRSVLRYLFLHCLQLSPLRFRDTS